MELREKKRKTFAKLNIMEHAMGRENTKVWKGETRNKQNNVLEGRITQRSIDCARRAENIVM